MKKWIVIVVAALMLTGCARETVVYETVGPVEMEPEPVPAAGQIKLVLPEGAAAEAMAEESGMEVYHWEGYELRLETLDSGDIQKTIQTITGIDYDSLTVMEHQKDGMQFYQTVWSGAGEEGLLLGRALVADDGYYHYCVSLLGPEDGQTQEIYDQLYATFAVRDSDSDSEK